MTRQPDGQVALAAATPVASVTVLLVTSRISPTPSPARATRSALRALRSAFLAVPSALAAVLATEPIEGPPKAGEAIDIVSSTAQTRMAAVAVLLIACPSRVGSPPGRRRRVRP